MDFDYIILVVGITVLNLSVLDTHRRPVTCIVLLDLLLSPRASSILNLCYGLSLVRSHILQTQMGLVVEHAVISVDAYLRCDVDGAFTFKIYVHFLHFFYWLICVHYNANMALFVHERLSSLKSFFKIRIQ